MSALQELAMGAAAGGAFQVISETFKLGGMLVGSLRDASIANNVEYRKLIEARGDDADKAAKRSPVWLRAVLSIIVFAAVFLLMPLLAGLADAPTSFVTEKEGWSILWGLYTSGSKMIVTTATGFVQGPEWGTTVRVIVGFTFSIGAVSTGKRVL